MLSLLKLALRITVNDFDNQLNMLISSAIEDLRIAGVTTEEYTADTLPVLMQQAVITYCMMHFGEPSDPERLKRSYDEQKAQLRTATGYTEWGDV